MLCISLVKPDKSSVLKETTVVMASHCNVLHYTNHIKKKKKEKRGERRERKEEKKRKKMKKKKKLKRIFLKKVLQEIQRNYYRLCNNTGLVMK